MDVLSTIFFKTILFTKTEGLIFVLYLIPGWISRLAESRDREIRQKVSPKFRPPRGASDGALSFRFLSL